MPEREKIKLSVLIHCYNNQDTIRGLLENVRWADEIVICDGFSQDRTTEICREYTDKVYQYEHKNSADQKNWTIPKCSHEWILHIDPDERLTNELVEEIRYWRGKYNGRYEAFRIPFKHYLFGRWIKGINLYPEYHERLFRKSLRFEEKHIHAHLMIKGDVGTLRGHIIHQGWESMDEIRRRFRRHRRLSLLQKSCEGRKYKIHHLILRPPALLLYLFIIKKGFIDGWRGFFYAGFIAVLEFYVLKDLLLGKASSSAQEPAKI